MISFETDYNNGMHPEILRRLMETNDEQSTGYGDDIYCARAKEKIRKACQLDEADIYFLIGGTQTNTTMIDALLASGEGVICTETAHINVHEAGAVEAFGHKVLALPSEDTKLTAQQVTAYMERFLADDSRDHEVQPGMIYITLPTEMGLNYSCDELAALYDVARRYRLSLYVDGARLGYGLAAEGADMTLPFLAHHCDAFYIGGTKVGAMFGEAVVFSQQRAPRAFFTTIKRHGALLAKGRMLGLQFDTLFTDDLYARISRHAINMAMRMKALFREQGFPLAIDSPTNQQFVILSANQRRRLAQHVAFEVWENLSDGRLICRFVTSWATTDNDLIELKKALIETNGFDVAEIKKALARMTDKERAKVREAAIAIYGKDFFEQNTKR